MCEISKSQRRTYRDQDPPRILETNGDDDAPAAPERAVSTEGEFFRKHQQRWEEASITADVAHRVDSTVITNGVKRDLDSCESLTNGKEMAPMMGVPPPPPAPHMGPDGLILPRKPYNPCLISNNHKDLRRELLFNQKIGKNVLNQKSELQRALEKQREAAVRREAERLREEVYKDDPRTALQRALEQRARQIELMEHPQSTEPQPNLLVTARAKLRTRTDSQ
ncbi:actin-associated protein FAM107A isoform X2 [Chelonus insularis]|uniref:actin-associated protein FAM107A isoform X2 n=1 Tax=Chelonus insularis TaxID=460826 RepID=UPI00158EFB67|nr:actin-associated protein FAM107A isoform X2 [Chelonus insularis]